MIQDVFTMYLQWKKLWNHVSGKINKRPMGHIAHLITLVTARKKNREEFSFKSWNINWANSTPGGHDVNKNECTILKDFSISMWPIMAVPEKKIIKDFFLQYIFLNKTLISHSCPTLPLRSEFKTWIYKM